MKCSEKLRHYWEECQRLPENHINTDEKPTKAHLFWERYGIKSPYCRSKSETNLDERKGKYLAWCEKQAEIDMLEKISELESKVADLQCELDDAKS